MNTSSTIGFGLVVGFIVYITTRGEFPAYLCVVGFGSNCPPPGQDATQTSAGSGSSVSSPSSTLSSVTAPPVQGSGPIEIGLPQIPSYPLPTLPAPPFPTYPGTTQTSSTFSYCTDTYGDVIDCNETSQPEQGATCYDENGQAVSCD